MNKLLLSLSKHLSAPSQPKARNLSNTPNWPNWGSSTSLSQINAAALFFNLFMQSL
ncbi:hypothetical protein Hanom_Chr07g00595411 [Helianthus anomalus]